MALQMNEWQHAEFSFEKRGTHIRGESCNGASRVLFHPNPSANLAGSRKRISHVH